MVRCSNVRPEVSLLNTDADEGAEWSGLEIGLRAFLRPFGCIRNLTKPLMDPLEGISSVPTLLWSRGCSAAPPGAKGFGTLSSTARCSGAGREGKRDGNCCDSHS